MNEQGWDLMAVLHTHYLTFSPSSPSALFSLHLPSHRQLHSARACCLNERSGPPWGEMGGSHYPQKCRGPTKGPWDIRVRERGQQREGEIGEHMKECISGGGGRDWLGWRDEGMDKERWRWEKGGVERGETLFLFYYNLYPCIQHCIYLHLPTESFGHHSYH